MNASENRDVYPPQEPSPSDCEPNFVERRGSPRARVLKKGKLILPNNSSVVDCLIRDVSATGARLSCEGAGMLPSEMQLLFHAVRELRHVRVVWRRQGELGVQFLSPARPALRLHL
jgi:hypothetical protein